MRTGNDSTAMFVNITAMTDEDNLELAFQGAVPMVIVPRCEFMSQI